jgi:hypothetical protein
LYGRQASHRSAGGDDIETLVERLLTDAAREVERDLEELLDGLRRLRAQRARLRELIQELDDESHELGDRLRSRFADVLYASGKEEEVSLRLQVALDRRAKLFQALSNVLKSLSDTDRQIAQNLK